MIQNNFYQSVLRQKYITHYAARGVLNAWSCVDKMTLNAPYVYIVTIKIGLICILYYNVYLTQELILNIRDI